MSMAGTAVRGDDGILDQSSNGMDGTAAWVRCRATTAADLHQRMVRLVCKRTASPLSPLVESTAGCAVRQIPPPGGFFFGETV